jgi:hypothetical protein
VSYQIDHSRLLARMKRARGGAPVTFSPDTLRSQSGDDVDGMYMEVPFNPEEWLNQDLEFSDLKTLLFVPTTYGKLPALGWVGVVVGKPRTVRASNPIQPDGTPYAARLLVE